MFVLQGKTVYLKPWERKQLQMFIQLKKQVEWQVMYRCERQQTIQSTESLNHDADYIQY